MRRSNFKFIIIALLFTTPIFAWMPPVDDRGDKEYELNYTESFTIDKDALIQFDTKHGNIRIKEGSGNKAVFDITISTDADDQEEADQIFDAIKIHFDDSRSSIYVETDIDFDNRKNKSWLSNIFGGWNNSVSFQIDMDVTLPNTVGLEIEHAFGDVYIPDMNSDLEIDIKHGNGRFANINGNAEVSIRHGKVKMGDVYNLVVECHHSDYTMGNGKEVEVEISHSDFEVDEADILELDARHSDITIGKAGRILNDSGHTDFEIESANYVDFETTFGDIEIDWLGNEGIFDLQHSSIDIDDISNEAKDIEVDGSHSNVVLDIEQSFSLDFEGSHVRPNIRHDLDYSEKDDEGNTYRYIGKIGSSPNLEIKIDLQHGSCRLND